MCQFSNQNMTQTGGLCIMWRRLIAIIFAALRNRHSQLDDILWHSVDFVLRRTDHCVLFDLLWYPNQVNRQISSIFTKIGLTSSTCSCLSASHFVTLTFIWINATVLLLLQHSRMAIALVDSVWIWYCFPVPIRHLAAIWILYLCKSMTTIVFTFSFS